MTKPKNTLENELRIAWKLIKEQEEVIKQLRRKNKCPLIKKRIVRFIGLKVGEIALLVLIIYSSFFIGRYYNVANGLGDSKCVGEFDIRFELGCFNFDSKDDYVVATIIGLIELIVLAFIISVVIIPIIKKNWEWAK